MSDMILCQSCGMPLEADEHFGTNQDGGKNADYCAYCFQNGAFTAEMTMDEMIAYCAEHAEEWGMKMTKEQATAAMNGYFPTLKRWSHA